MTNSAPTTEEREQFMSEFERLYPDTTYVIPHKLDLAWAIWQAARRTAPDVRAMALLEAANLADEMILYAGCDIANTLRALAAKKGADTKGADTKDET